MDNVFIDGMGESVAPQPVTTAEAYANLVRRTGLVDEAQLVDAVNRFQTLPKQRRGRSDAAALAYFLLQSKILSAWQTKMILQGRWRGFTLGKYRLLDRIGTGGMSSVFLAEHPLMKRKVAIKVLPRSSAEKDSRVKRFLKEAELVSSLDHPNVVKAYHFDAEHDRYYLIMEFIDGINLQQKVDREGPLRFDLAADYVAQSAKGLAYAHSAGLIHRDVKPANLLVDRDGIVKVLDLGLARSMAPNATSYTQDRTGKVLGTADYVAPEQVKDSHDVDARTDIYSLGCTLYFLLSGRAPFSEGNLANKLAMHLYHQPESLREQRADTPLSLERICLKMMAKKREDRYQSAGEVCDVLLRWLQDFKKGVETRETNEILEEDMEEASISVSSGLDGRTRETASLGTLTSSPPQSDSATTVISDPDTEIPAKNKVQARAPTAPTPTTKPRPQSEPTREVAKRSPPEPSRPAPSRPAPNGQAAPPVPPIFEADSGELSSMNSLGDSIGSGEERSGMDIELTGPAGAGRPKPTSPTRKKKKRRRVPDVMTIEEVAKYLRLPAEALEGLAQRGKIPAQQILGQWRFHRESIDRWLQQTNFETNTWVTLKSHLQADGSQITLAPQNGQAQAPPRPSGIAPPSPPSTMAGPPPTTLSSSPSSLNRRSEMVSPPSSINHAGHSTTYFQQQPSVGECDPSLQELLLTLEDSGLLNDEALENVRGQVLGGRMTDVPATLMWLRQLGWLTDYQLAILRQGRRTGLRYGDYIVIERIGSGGMAVVYKARHRNTGQIVALKVMQHDSAQSAEDEAKRFDREVRAVAKLNHPNIVAAWDAVSDDRESYLVLEYVDGENLDQRVRHGGPMNVAEAVDFLLQMAQGLQHAHSKQMVHRDVKPGNLLVDARGTIKILDLGLVRFDHTLGGVSGSLAQPLTTQETVLGTPDFMAPEQFADARSADNRADIYSLGCTLYFMLTGVSPFERGSPTKTLQAHQTEPPPKLTDACPSAPQSLQMIFEKMVAKAPRHRYQSMDEIIADLEEYVLPAVGASSQAMSSGKRMISQRNAAPSHGSSSMVGRRTAIVRRSDLMPSQASSVMRPKSQGSNKLLLGTCVGAGIGVVLGGVATMWNWSLAQKLVELCSGVPLPPVVLLAGLGAIFWGGVGFLIAELTSSGSSSQR
jgi:excisionase family DNA binding protein